jgi:tetratricopeptide (TPR) repeat protein
MKSSCSIFLIIACLFQACTSKKAVVSSNSSSGANALIFESAFYEATRLRLQGENAKALEKYLQCTVLNPNNGAVQFYTALLYNQDGKFSEGKAYIKKAVSLDANNADYLETLASTHMQLGETQEAADTYRRLAKLRPNLAEDYLSSAAYQFMRKGKLQSALELLLEAEKSVGSNTELSFKKINLYRRLDQTEDAVKTTDELIKSAAETEKLRFLMIKLDILEEAKQKDRANKLYDDIVAKYPQDGAVQYMQIEKYIAERDTVKYLGAIGKLMDNKDVEPERKVEALVPFMNIAQRDTTKKPQLVALGKKLIDGSPNDAKAIKIYANILSSAGQVKEASAQYSKLIDKEPKDFSHWQQLLTLYSANDLPDSVITIGKRALNYFPNQAMVHYITGLAFVQKKENDNAVKSLKKADDYAEGNVDLQAQVLAALADVYNTTGKYEESDIAFDKALKLNPKDASTLNNYAYYLSERGVKLEQAAQMSKLSLVEQPNEKTFLDTYAWILFKQGKFAEALSTQQKAIAVTGDNDAVLYEHLGDIYAKLGQIENAVQQWQKAKAMDTNKSNPKLDKKISTKQLLD